MELLEKIISEKPRFHDSETEIVRSFEINESLLDKRVARKHFTSELMHHGIEENVLRFLNRTIDKTSRTLETGAGSSTLVFAIQQTKHIVITPSVREIQRIRDYAKSNAIRLDTVNFIPELSEKYLPNCDAEELDVILIDGKHAFPWPIIDWFYTVDKLQNGGLLLLDDAQMRSVSILTEFMSVDQGWEMIHNFHGKTLVFQKTRDKVLDVAWHMQPWTVSNSTKLSGIMDHFKGFIGYRVQKR